MGVVFFMGWASAAKHFANKDKLAFNSAFFGGFILIVLRWSILGAMLQGVSMFLFFRASSGLIMCMCVLGHL